MSRDKAQPTSHASLARPSQSTDNVWMLALAALTLLYFLSFFNRFAGLRSGNGEFVTGMALLHGHLPFRDYFSATPVLNTFKSALLLRIFGPFLLVSRLAGVCERVAITLVLYRWLRGCFAAPASFVAALTTIIVSSGDRADPIASYNHDAIFFAILAAFAASRALVAAEEGGRFALYSLASGFFAGLCLLTKQTVGLGAVVVVPAFLFCMLLRAAGPRKALRWLAWNLLGCALPLIFFAAWLAAMGLLPVFWQMVFRDGPAAKGGHIADFLRREWIIALGNPVWITLALLAMLLGSRAFLRAAAGRTTALTVATARLPWLAGAAAAVILTAQALSSTTIPALRDFSKSSLYFTLFACASLSIYYGVCLLRGRLDRRSMQFALWAVASFSVAGMLSLSWPAFEAMALPGLAFLVAGILEGSRARGRSFALLVFAAMVFLAVREKLDLPFAFGALDERPVREATSSCHLPELRGLRLPASMCGFLQQSVAIAATQPAERTIFTYPEMALLYELTGRNYPTLAESHNVDVVNDRFAAAEAARLFANPPALVFTFALSPGETEFEDRVWRFGKPSGQHVLAAAVAQLTAGYRREGAYAIGSNGKVITIWSSPQADTFASRPPAPGEATSVTSHDQP